MKRFFFAAIVGGFLAVAVAGCGGATDDPTVTDPTLGTVSSAVEAFGSHDSLGDHDRGKAAGHAVLSAQAFILPSGVTEIDISTASLHTQTNHPEPALGDISIAFFRILNASGKTVSFATTGLRAGGVPGGGCVHFQIGGLVAGDTVQVLALVRDYPGDGKKTDVVTASAVIMTVNPGN